MSASTTTQNHASFVFPQPSAVLGEEALRLPAALQKGFAANEQLTNFAMDKVRNGSLVVAPGERGFHVRALQLAMENALRESPEKVTSYFDKNRDQLVSYLTSGRSMEPMVSYLQSHEAERKALLGSNAKDVTVANIAKLLNDSLSNSQPLPAEIAKIVLDNFAIDGDFGSRSATLVKIIQATADQALKVDGKIGSQTLSLLEQRNQIAYHPGLEPRQIKQNPQPIQKVSPEPVPTSSTAPAASSPALEVAQATTLDAVIEKRRFELENWGTTDANGKPLVSDQRVAEVVGELKQVLNLSAAETLKIAHPEGGVSAINDNILRAIVSSADGDQSLSYDLSAKQLTIAGQTYVQPTEQLSALTLEFPQVAAKAEQTFAQRAKELLAPYVANGALAQYGKESVVLSGIESLAQAPLIPRSAVATTAEVNHAVSRAFFPEGYNAKLAYNEATLSAFNPDGCLGGQILREDQPIALFKYQPLDGGFKVVQYNQVKEPLDSDFQTVTPSSLEAWLSKL